MNWQLMLAGALVVVAAAYVARTTWRTWTSARGGCGGGCGCPAAAAKAKPANGQATFLPVEQLGLRRRESNGS